MLNEIIVPRVDEKILEKYGDYLEEDEYNLTRETRSARVKKQAHQKILQISSSAKKIAIKIKIIMSKKKNVQAICLVMIS